MSGLLIPRHVAAMRAKARANAAAETVSGERNSAYAIDTDEFITPAQVDEQLAKLRSHIDMVRKQNPDYTLPKPMGWKICVLMLTLPTKTSGGLELINDAVDAHAMASPQGVVLSFGPACYTDPDRFAINGELVPWAKIGDRVTWTKYDVATFKLANHQLLGFLTDTQPVSNIDGNWEVPS